MLICPECGMHYEVCICLDDEDINEVIKESDEDDDIS